MCYVLYILSNPAINVIGLLTKLKKGLIIGYNQSFSDY